jgi:hypothetical protein
MFSLFHYLALHMPQHTTQTTENKTNTTLTLGKKDLGKYPAQQWHLPTTLQCGRFYRCLRKWAVNFNY